jgi:hypothetical protein
MHFDDIFPIGTTQGTDILNDLPSEDVGMQVWPGASDTFEIYRQLLNSTTAGKTPDGLPQQYSHQNGRQSLVDSFYPGQNYLVPLTCNVEVTHQQAPAENPPAQAYSLSDTNSMQAVFRTGRLVEDCSEVVKNTGKSCAPAPRNERGQTLRTMDLVEVDKLSHFLSFCIDKRFRQGLLSIGVKVRKSWSGEKLCLEQGSEFEPHLMQRPKFRRQGHGRSGSAGVVRS